MAIYRWESGTYTRIVGSGDSILGKPPVFSLSPPVISNSGSIAFEALFASSVAINDLGNVLFSASSNGSTAIFSGGDPLNDRIIGTGDSLDGGRIVGLTFQNGMLNDQNEFVFYATLDDNNDGLADRGTVFLGLTAVPEPTSCVLCLTSCLTVICLKRARKKPR